MIVYNELSTLLPDSYDDAAKNKKNKIYRGNEFFLYILHRKAFMMW